MKKKYLIIIGIICLLVLGTIVWIINKKDNSNDSSDSIVINNIDEESANSLDADIKNIEKSITITNGKIDDIDELSDYSFYKNLVLKNDYDSIVLNAIYVRSNKEKDVYDVLNNYVLTISNNDSDKKIEIGFSKDNEVLRDYYFSSKEDTKSIVNNTELKLYKYGTSYMTIFKYKDVNYDIETRNITEDEFLLLLKSIIK